MFSDQEGTFSEPIKSPVQPYFTSNIRISNSIISPHTFHFSTHVGEATKMQWEKVAKMPL